jgi:long-subunit acyl-CoA synthetase (AMP-forming)
MRIDWRDGSALPGAGTTSWPVYLRRRAGLFGDRVVLVEASGAVWSWRQLLARSAGLAERLGLKSGDRLAFPARSSAESLVLLLACWRLGVVPLPHSNRVDGALLADFAADQTLDEEAVLALCADAPADGPDRWYQEDPAAPALVLATSGSGGSPKGVLLPQRSLVSQQMAYALLWPRMGPADVVVPHLPWHHSFGLLADLLWCLLRGARCHLGDGRDVEGLQALCRAVQPSVLQSVPKVHDALSRADLGGRLRWVFSAGAPLAQDCVERWQQRGLAVAEGWGQTECGPAACIRPGFGGAGVGRPIPGVSVGIDETGEIWVRGPGLMLSYLDGSGLRNGRGSGDGMLATGDLGRWQEGALHLIGRADRSRKLANGEKVHLDTIEGQLSAAGLRGAATVVDGRLQVVLLGEVQPGDERLRRFNAAQDQAWCRLRQCFRCVLEPSLGNGLLTDSLKLNRRRLAAMLLEESQALEVIPVVAD